MNTFPRDRRTIGGMGGRETSEPVWLFYLCFALIICVGLMGNELMKGAPPEPGTLRAGIAQEKNRIDREIAALQQFSDRLGDLDRVARRDPEEALRRRLPMETCEASILAPDCHRFPHLFRLPAF